MKEKISRLIVGMFEILSKREKVEIYLVPAIMAFIIYFLIPKLNLPRDVSFYNISTKFMEVLITISSILTAFGVATTTILTTSSNENIEKAREEIIDKKRFGIPINFYEYLLVKNFYSVAIQLFVLFFSVFGYFMVQLQLGNRVITSIGIFLFLHSLCALFSAIVSIYHLMWRE